MDTSDGPKLSLEDHKNQLFDAIENQDEKAFVSLLGDKLLQNIPKLRTCKNSAGFTLMQEAAKQEMGSFVKELLRVNVSGNGDSDGPENPVLIAAKFGNFAVLQEFKEQNNKVAEGHNCERIDFSVSTKSGAETVLHLVLKRWRLLDYDTDFELRDNHGCNDKASAQLNKSPSLYRMQSCKLSKDNVRKLTGKYKRCFDVLVSDTNESHSKVLRSIVNKQDGSGATPLHYAVKNWTKEVTKGLLDLGADITVNTHDEKPLLYEIPADTIKEFLDKKCMFADGFNVEEDSDCGDADEEESEDAFEHPIDYYDSTYMRKIKKSNVTFSYRLLLPSQHRPEEKLAENGETNSKAPEMLEGVGNTNPESLMAIVEEEKRRANFMKDHIPEENAVRVEVKYMLSKFEYNRSHIFFTNIFNRVNTSFTRILYLYTIYAILIESFLNFKDLTPPSRSRRSRLPAYSKVTKNRTNSKKNTELPKTGSLDIYNNFQWIVEKGKEEEELSLSSTKGEHAVLDLALVMDCTASMGPWIHHSKNTLSEVIDNIKSSASTSKEKKGIYFR